LEAIGGLAEIANHLADDYKLGELVRNAGQRIVLSSYVVTGKHHEPSLNSVTRHEMRWMRTLAVLRPLSFRGLFLTFSLPLSLIGLGLLSNQAPLPPLAMVLLTITVASRLALHFVHRFGGDRRMLADFWLLPVRDLLICWVWIRSLFTSRVIWRGNEFDIDADGIMRRL
jgi:ceramide glucosyltransferase